MSYLHTVRIQFARVGDASRLLDFDETSAKSLELIVNR
jgi:hypothetical protein